MDDNSARKNEHAPDSQPSSKGQQEDKNEDNKEKKDPKPSESSLVKTTEKPPIDDQDGIPDKKNEHAPESQPLSKEQHGDKNKDKNEKEEPETPESSLVVTPEKPLTDNQDGIPDKNEHVPDSQPSSKEEQEDNNEDNKEKKDPKPSKSSLVETTGKPPTDDQDGIPDKKNEHVLESKPSSKEQQEGKKEDKKETEEPEPLQSSLVETTKKPPTDNQDGIPDKKNGHVPESQPSRKEQHEDKNEDKKEEEDPEPSKSSLVETIGKPPTHDQDGIPDKKNEHVPENQPSSQEQHEGKNEDKKEMVELEAPQNSLVVTTEKSPTNNQDGIPDKIPALAQMTTDSILLQETACQRLNAYYIQQKNESSDDKKEICTVPYEALHFLTEMESHIALKLSDLGDLLKFDCLDVGLLRCFILHLMKEVNNERVGFLDPEVISLTWINTHMDGAVDHVRKAMNKYSRAEYLMGAHFFDNHWILLVISLKWEVVWYLDSLRRRPRDHSKLIKVLDDAYSKSKHQDGLRLRHITDFECHQQPEGTSRCAFYVAQHMLTIATGPQYNNLKTANDFRISEEHFGRSELVGIQERIAKFLNEFIHMVDIFPSEDGLIEETLEERALSSPPPPWFGPHAILKAVERLVVTDNVNANANANAGCTLEQIKDYFKWVRTHRKRQEIEGEEMMMKYIDWELLLQDIGSEGPILQMAKETTIQEKKISEVHSIRKKKLEEELQQLMEELPQDATLRVELDRLVQMGDLKVVAACDGEQHYTLSPPYLPPWFRPEAVVKAVKDLDLIKAGGCTEEQIRQSLKDQYQPGKPLPPGFDTVLGTMLSLLHQKGHLTWGASGPGHYTLGQQAPALVDTPGYVWCYYLGYQLGSLNDDSDSMDDEEHALMAKASNRNAPSWFCPRTVLQQVGWGSERTWQEIGVSLMRRHKQTRQDLPPGFDLDATLQATLAALSKRGYLTLKRTRDVRDVHIFGPRYSRSIKPPSFPFPSWFRPEAVLQAVGKFNDYDKRDKYGTTSGRIRGYLLAMHNQSHTPWFDRLVRTMLSVLRQRGYLRRGAGGPEYYTLQDAPVTIGIPDNYLLAYYAGYKQAGRYDLDDSVGPVEAANNVGMRHRATAETQPPSSSDTDEGEENEDEEEERKKTEANKKKEKKREQLLRGYMIWRVFLSGFGHVILFGLSFIPGFGEETSGHHEGKTLKEWLKWVVMDAVVPIVVLIVMLLIQFFTDNELEDDTSQQTPEDKKRMRVDKMVNLAILGASRLFYFAIKEAPGPKNILRITAHVFAFVMDMGAAIYLWKRHSRYDQDLPDNPWKAE